LGVVAGVDRRVDQFATNAIVRKAFNTSSNAFLEIQWYLFAAVFLLAAGYTMLRQEHVRIDVLLGRFSASARKSRSKRPASCLFLFPFCWKVIHLVWPLVVNGLHLGRNVVQRGRPDPLAGVRLGAHWLCAADGPGPVGIHQAHSRILQGLIDDPTQRKQNKSAEEELAEFVRAKAEAAAVAGGVTK
jgi:TRAP-type C4-dicarboxylate transport system permease small subunit